MAKAQEKGRNQMHIKRKTSTRGFLKFCVCVCVYACFGRKYGRRVVGAGMVEDDEKASWGQIIKDVLMPS